MRTEKTNCKYCTRLLCNRAHRNMTGMERRIQNPVQHLTWSFWQILLTAQACFFAKSFILNLGLGSKYAPVKKYIKK